MIHVITSENRARYERQLAEHHRIRHQIYIGERNWFGIEDRDGLEFDQFDNDDTIYLLEIDGNGAVVGGTRMYPTTKPHLMSHVWPELAAVKGVPAAPDIFEWTRLFIAKDRRQDGKDGQRMLGRLFASGLEYGLQEGIRELSLQFEPFWFPRLQRQGFKITPLGLPTKIRDEWWIGATIAVTEEALQSTRAYYDVQGPLLVKDGITGPAIRRAA